MVTRQGEVVLPWLTIELTLCVGEQQPFIRNIFTLNSCSNIVGSDVRSYSKEVDLLEAWRDFVEQVDPDVIIGYNISAFDFPYLIDRAAALKSEKFPQLGRLKGSSRAAMYVKLNMLCRKQNNSKKYSLLFESVWAARLEGNGA